MQRPHGLQRLQDHKVQCPLQNVRFVRHAPLLWPAHRSIPRHLWHVNRKAALNPRSPLRSSTPAERAELPHQPDLDQTHLECGGSTPLLHSIYNSGVLSREHFAERLHGRVALNGGATQRFPRKKWGPRLGPGAPKGAFQLPVSFSHRRVGSSILASLSEAGGTIREKCRASPFPLARLSTRIAIRNAPNDFPICTSRANGCETGL